jgi:glycopeptide antibiotics resistance protein
MGAVLQAFFTIFLEKHVGIAILLALLFSIAIGYGFELFSKFTGYGHYEFLDAVAAVVGAMLGIGAILLIHLL